MKELSWCGNGETKQHKNLESIECLKYMRVQCKSYPIFYFEILFLLFHL